MDNPLIDLETFLQSPTIKYILSQLPDNNNFLKEDATVHSIVLRLEHTLRFHGAHLIHQACSLLKLTQVCVATAQLIFMRFYYRQSMHRIGIFDIAMGSVFLASKLLETPKRVREVVNVFHYLQNALYNKCPSEALLVDYKEVVLEYVGEGYYDLRDRATFAENVILRELGFHLEFYLPYGLLINYCQVLQLLIPDEPSLNTQEKPREATHKSHHKQEDLKITQKALGYLNDSFYTPVHMLFQPNVLACAVISLACQDEELNLLPLHPPWYHVFDTFEREFHVVQSMIMSVYSLDDTLSEWPFPPPLTETQFISFIQKTVLPRILST